MGEKEQGAGGRDAARAVASADPEGGGIAIGEEGVQSTGVGSGERATNLNSSRSNVYRSTGSEGSGAGGGALEASNLNLSKSNINRTAIGDPDFDLAAQKKMPERDKDVSQ